MLITAVSTLRHCHFREPFGVLASHNLWEKVSYAVAQNPVSASRRVPDGARELSSMLALLYVAGLSPGESVAQKWRQQQALKAA